MSLLVSIRNYKAHALCHSNLGARFIKVTMYGPHTLTLEGQDELCWSRQPPMHVTMLWFGTHKPLKLCSNNLKSTYTSFVWSNPPSDVPILFVELLDWDEVFKMISGRFGLGPLGGYLKNWMCTFVWLKNLKSLKKQQQQLKLRCT